MFREHWNVILYANFNYNRVFQFQRHGKHQRGKQEDNIEKSIVAGEIRMIKRFRL